MEFSFGFIQCNNLCKNILDAFSYGSFIGQSRFIHNHLPPNPPQMCILERVLVLQAVAEHTVKAGVTEQKLRRSGMIIDSGMAFYQPRRGVRGLARIMPSFQDLETGWRKI